MIITVSSVGGSPGVTSWAVLLAAAWPSESAVERIVVEADLDGAVMGARFGIGVEPGTSTLVSATRRIAEGSIDLTEFGRRVDPLVWLIPGPESAEASRRLWGSPGVSESVADAACRDDRTWLFDVGRGGPNGLHAPLHERAEMGILLCRSEHESLVQVPARIASMKQATRFTGVIVVGKPAFGVAELQSFFGSERTWLTGAGDDLVDVSRQVWGERRVKRSQPWRSAVGVAADIADTLRRRSVEVAPCDAEVGDAG